MANISCGKRIGNGTFRTFEVSTSLRESCIVYGSTPSVMFSFARYRNRSLSAFWGAACQATRQDLVVFLAHHFERQACKPWTFLELRC